MTQIDPEDKVASTRKRRTQVPQVPDVEFRTDPTRTSATRVQARTETSNSSVRQKRAMKSLNRLDSTRRRRSGLRRATLTVEELKRVLGIGRAAAYTALNEGIIPSFRIGRRFIIPRAAVESWLSNVAAEASARDERSPGAPLMRRRD